MFFKMNKGRVKEPNSFIKLSFILLVPFHLNAFYKVTTSPILLYGHFHFSATVNALPFLTGKQIEIQCGGSYVKFDI